MADTGPGVGNIEDIIQTIVPKRKKVWKKKPKHNDGYIKVPKKPNEIAPNGQS